MYTTWSVSIQRVLVSNIGSSLTALLDVVRGPESAPPSSERCVSIMRIGDRVLDGG